MAKTPEDWWPIDRDDQTVSASRSMNIANWSEEERNAALELIRSTVER
ncbi:hypothetical protein ACFSQ3_01080 [Sphingobacterium corticis]|uniref:Transcriptional regulator n=1 Tax=Sphingobacterium corticis TaxID=1812823 RepID=A0ABW5NH61_9SPHI